MNSLRIRLIFSHIIPLVVIVPLVAVAIIYLLESQVLLSNLSTDLEKRAASIAATTIDQVDVWYDRANAQAFVRRTSSTINMPVMLLDPQGDLLASSNPTDVDQAGKALKLPGLDQALGGKTSLQLHYPNFLRPEFADIFMPVIASDGHVVGVIRLTDQLEGFQERFTQIRSLIAWVSLVGLLLGGLMGWILAHNLEKSLALATDAIVSLSERSENEMSISIPPVAEEGLAEIRLLIRAFNALTERLQTLEISRRRLLANLVHELGRPLGALSSAVQALENGADEDHRLQHELLTGMDGEISRLHDVLDDLAHLHDQTLGLQELNIEPTKVAPWLTNMLAPWRESAQAKQIVWQVDQADTSLTVKMDTDRISQALGNLLSNAIKYTPKKGRIIVSDGEKKTQAGTEFFLRVSNSGPVLSSEEQKRIFAPFYRGRSATRFPQGMGLGLTIARDLAAAHGGRLEVEGEPGFGNHFTIWLPITNE